jgi:broad specificity phosphatase PhoE
MPKKIFFIRHAKTPGNIPDPHKGTRFIGRNSDYRIISPEKEKIKDLKKKIKKENIEIVFSSPARRCKETCKLITDKEPVEEGLLHEIDYGEVDKMLLKDAQEKYPELFQAWKQGKDPRYPGGGENSQDVFNRVEEFVEKVKNIPENKILACSHSFFFRALFGHTFGIPLKEWFKVHPPHFELFEFELSDEDNLIYKGSEKQKTKILENL